ncbi:MAG: four-carbon acid sugar kinase family protein [Verrucomicrobiota bacterium]|nr:four-carbon acid sugar kinase family protein [Limisphaera sp.]MDW8382106.1 four-carbon acid sugar kinase family protein [Verrucomicrobiota bacterium]
MIVVVADDLTGAAELAGTAHVHGQPALLARRPPWPEVQGVLCIDTQTRDLPALQAASQVACVVREVSEAQPSHCYKKVDSVLRGAVLAEVEITRRCLDRTRVLLLPANPSRNRVICDGRYYVEGQRIDETEFARDPRHPRATAWVTQLLSEWPGVVVAVRKPTEPFGDEQVTVAEARSPADVAAWAARVSPDMLPAGGVDFFSALLEDWCEDNVATSSNVSPNPQSGVPECLNKAPQVPSTKPSLLLVSGTSSSRALAWIAQSKAMQVPVIALLEEFAPQFLPDTSFDHTRLRGRIGDLTQATRAVLCLQSTAPREAVVAPLAQAWLELLADTAICVMERAMPDLVLVEGGATAGALLNRLPWSWWRVTNEWAPGVVEIRPPALDRPTLLLKPGSYPWPDRVSNLWFGSKNESAFNEHPGLQGGF